MAAAFIPFDKTKDIPRSMDRYGRMLIEAVEGLTAVRAAAMQQRDGDGSQASHYDQMASQGGYTAGDYADANAAAKASFDELNSIVGKLTTNASITDMSAGIYQFAAKHGIIN